jgi:hypothetical protein
MNSVMSAKAIASPLIANYDGGPPVNKKTKKRSDGRSD